MFGAAGKLSAVKAGAADRPGTSWGGTWDPSFGPTITYSNGNLTADIGGNRTARGTVSYSAGRRYIEYTIDRMAGVGPYLGFNAVGVDGGTGFYGLVVSATATTLIVNGASAGSISMAVSATDRIGLDFNFVDRSIRIYKNGVRVPALDQLNVPAGSYYPMAASPGGQYTEKVTMYPNVDVST